MNNHIKTLILFRHGETDWNRQGIIQGQIDISINDTGREQAHLLGTTLKDKKLDIIISSDLRRAHETAEIVNSYFSVPLHTTPALREVHVGTCQGKPRSELMQTEFWNYFTNDHPDYDHLGHPEGETKAQAKKRALDWLHTFVTTTDHTHIGICSHGTVLRLAIIALTGHVVQFSNCEYATLEYDTRSGSWNLQTSTHDKVHYEHTI